MLSEAKHPLSVTKTDPSLRSPYENILLLQYFLPLSVGMVYVGVATVRAASELALPPRTAATVVPSASAVVTAARAVRLTV